MRMLKIGVPSKGRLMEKTFEWFGARGITMRQSGAEREYAGTVEGIDGIELGGRHPNLHILISRLNQSITTAVVTVQMGIDQHLQRLVTQLVVQKINQQLGMRDIARIKQICRLWLLE